MKILKILSSLLKRNVKEIKELTEDDIKRIKFLQDSLIKYEIDKLERSNSYVASDKYTKGSPGFYSELGELYQELRVNPELAKGLNIEFITK